MKHQQPETCFETGFIVAGTNETEKRWLHVRCDEVSVECSSRLNSSGGMVSLPP